VTETQLNVATGFDVSVVCASGYEPAGSGPSASSCGTPSDNYILSGCALNQEAQALLTADLSQAVVAGLLQDADADETQDTAATLSAALNQRDVDDSEVTAEGATEARAELITALDSIITADYITADTISAASASLATVVERPDEISVDAADTALELVELITLQGESMDYPVEAVGAATSSMFATVALQTESGGNNEERGSRLANVISSIGATMANKLEAGEDPVSLATDEFVLTVEKGSPEAFAGKTLAGVVEVPAGALAVAYQYQEVFSQVVSYSGSGPLFWTPSVMTDGSSGQLASGLTSVTFNVASGGRRQLQGGTELQISGLSEPFLITIPVTSPPDFVANLGGRSLEEVDTYIARLWNRTSLAAETLSTATEAAMATCSFGASNYTEDLELEREQLRRREVEEELFCPSKPDSCDAAERAEEAVPGCSGIRGGAEDCARWPEECNCMRGLLRKAYLGDQLLCSYWDETTKAWREDGELVERTDDSATCAFTHLTSFSNFIGPAPTFNRMSVEGLFSKEWITNNPVSAITAFSTLFLSLVTTLLSVKIYNDLVSEVSAEDQERESYEYRTSAFVQQRQLLERDDVSWFAQAHIKLRTEWPIGAFVFGYAGDPYLKSQRLLVMWGAVLIGMVLNVIFFTKPNPECYDACPDETYSGGDAACAERCDAECEGNGLMASILSAVISIPICGTLVSRFAEPLLLCVLLPLASK
jgi:hypothetical protein